MGVFLLTGLFFVRHAQPDVGWEDDRTRPLTHIGLEDCRKVTAALKNYKIDFFYSSPYKRSIDTLLDCANKFCMIIPTDERLREREKGINSFQFVEKRWQDFSFCEENGESLACVQQRNIQALTEILNKHPNQNIVIGTHGTALSTVLHYYDPTFGFEGFKRIWFSMPYIIKLDFEGDKLIKSTELLKIDRGYR